MKQHDKWLFEMEFWILTIALTLWGVWKIFLYIDKWGWEYLWWQLWG